MKILKATIILVINTLECDYIIHHLITWITFMSITLTSLMWAFLRNSSLSLALSDSSVTGMSRYWKRIGICRYQARYSANTRTRASSLSSERRGFT